jgi:DNA polymerase V
MKRLEIPLVSPLVEAGFPSPADDYIDQSLDLNEYLIRHPAATFMVRVNGDSMAGGSINSGDILIVDRSLEPRSGNVVIAVLDGELTVKRYRRTDQGVVLMPDSEEWQPVHVTEDMDFAVWGVCTFAIHRL